MSFLASSISTVDILHYECFRIVPMMQTNMDIVDFQVQVTSASTFYPNDAAPQPASAHTLIEDAMDFLFG